MYEINLDVLPIKYWSIKTKIEYLQRKVIIYSLMYYKLNTSCITDKEYDKISYQLLELMNSTPDSICRKTQYWYCMKDFDGNTGFDIPDRLNKSDKDYLMGIAEYVLHLWMSERVK